ncbi:hypothetical protein PC114_g18156 [Phytophthora cactorum]|nr:hypothetical protein PC114_g18156 [Phytophthora cactorum]
MDTNKRKKRELTPQERQCAICEVLARSCAGQPRRGAMKEVGVMIPINGLYDAPSLKHLSGKKPRDRSSVLERLRHINLQQRTTIRATARACGVPSTTLFRRLKQGKLRSCTSVAKSALTEDNMKTRVKFCLDHVDTSSFMYNDLLMGQLCAHYFGLHVSIY